MTVLVVAVALAVVAAVAVQLRVLMVVAVVVTDAVAAPMNVWDVLAAVILAVKMVAKVVVALVQVALVALVAVILVKALAEIPVQELVKAVKIPAQEHVKAAAIPVLEPVRIPAHPVTLPAKVHVLGDVKASVPGVPPAQGNARAAVVLGAQPGVRPAAYRIVPLIVGQTAQVHVSGTVMPAVSQQFRQQHRFWGYFLRGGANSPTLFYGGGEMQTEVPAEMKYVLDRGGFECIRAVSNVSFMLSRHLNDMDDSFLDSSLFGHIQERAEEATMQNGLIMENVASVLIKGRAGDFRFVDDNYVLEYREVL